MNDAVRRQAELLHERNENISPSEFAGRMARETPLGLREALDLYEDLTDTEVERETDETNAGSEIETDGGAVEGETAPPAGIETEGGTEPDDGSDGDDFPPVSLDDVKAHYDRLGDLYTELGTIGDNTLAAGVTGRKGWYTDRPSTVAGWDSEGRQTTLARDYDVLRENLAWVDNRSIHATVQYSKADRYAESWKPFKRSAGGREWADDGESPTLDYADIEAYAPFADIDLEDEYKPLRHSGDLDTGPIEDALGEYIEAFTELAGGREHVYALDSVGGAYVMVAPTCTRPIAECFSDDRDAREQIFAELRARIDEWLDGVRERVNDTVPDVQGVFEPDLLNQKNRNYKAPLTVHKDLDGVVTPLDTESPSYEFTHLTEADGALIEDATEWAADFTSEHDSAVEGVVRTLWADEYAIAGTWEDALQMWVDEKRTEEQKREERREKTIEEREERLDALGTSLTGQTVTPHIDDVFDAADAVDIKSLVRRHCKEWEPAPAKRTNHFNPGSRLWKESDSGTSCFINTTKNIFVDTGDNGGNGGPAKFMALKEGAISYPSQSAEGSPFWVGVEALRDEGHDIPVYVPERGTTKQNGETYEKTPFWGLRKAAVALRIVPEDGFVEKEGDDGGTYEAFPGAVTFNRTLDELETLGYDHGWERDEDRDDISMAEISEMETTDDMDVINAAHNHIDVMDVARKIADDVEQRDADTLLWFTPSWRDGMQQCRATSSRFEDPEEGGEGGGALRLVARHHGWLPDCRQSLSDATADEHAFWRSIAALRDLGFHIPKFEGRRGQHPDVMGVYETPEDEDDARRKTIRAALFG